MAKCKVKENSKIKLTMSVQEAQVLTSLLGNHVIGDGENNIILSDIWSALNQYVADIGYLPTNDDESVVYIK